MYFNKPPEHNIVVTSETLKVFKLHKRDVETLLSDELNDLLKRLALNKDEIRQTITQTRRKLLPLPITDTIKATAFPTASPIARRQLALTIRRQISTPKLHRYTKSQTHLRIDSPALFEYKSSLLLNSPICNVEYVPSYQFERRQR